MKIAFNLREDYLTEANRQQLLSKSRKAKKYSPKNRAKGDNRFERRRKSQVHQSVREYNVIDMDRFFKRDYLSFGIPVIGETDTYLVSIEIQGVLQEIQRNVKQNKGKLEFKVVIASLSKLLNFGDVNIGCTCPDAKYRMAYNQTKGGYKAGYKETRPSDKTNPDDELGAGCKHTLLVLSNLSWIYKVASVINNYIKYSRERLEHNYVTYIFPKVYGMRYNKAVQLKLFYDDEESGLLPSDQEAVSKAIERGMIGKDDKGRFVAQNPLRFQKRGQEEEEENSDQVKLELDI